MTSQDGLLIDSPAEVATKVTPVAAFLPAGTTVVTPPPAANSQTPVQDQLLKVGDTDRHGRTVVRIFAQSPGRYTLYQTLAVESARPPRGRLPAVHLSDICIQFADDPVLAREQRQNIQGLGGVFHEVSTLLAGWRRRASHDRQLAYGLELALDGQADGARDILATVRRRLLAERHSSGRQQYLLTTVFSTVGLALALTGLEHLHELPSTGISLWLAAKAGLVGAAFSIVLGIRRRTVAMDTNLEENTNDVLVRLLIGIISAGVFMLLLKSGVIVPEIRIGGQASLTGPDMTWETVNLVGFLAGFLERLVPDLLDKPAAALLTGRESAGPPAPPPQRKNPA